MDALFHPYVVTGFLTSIITTGVGIFVYTRNTYHPVHRAFLIFSASIAQWSCFTAVHAMQHDAHWSLFWAKFCHIGAMLIPVFFYYFTLKITGRERKNTLLTGFVIAFLLILLTFATPFFIPGTRTDVGVPNFTKAGPLYFLMIIFFSVYVLLSLIHLWNEIRISTGTRKKHLQYFFYASLLGFSIGGVNFCPVYGITLWPYPYSAICGAIYSCVIAYAILKHKLFDIELIVKRGLVFGVLFGIVYVAVSAFIFIAGYFVARRPLPLLSGISIALAMVLYEPLKGLLTGLTNRFLFQKKIAYTILIQSLIDQLANGRDEEALSTEIVNFLTRQMSLEWAALYLKSSDGYRFQTGSAKENLDGLHDIESLIAAKKAPLILSPFDVEGELQPEIKAKLRQNKIEAIVPILVEDSLYGILLLGKKKSDDGFLPEDEALLQTLMDEAAMLFLSGRLLKEVTLSNLELGQRMKMASLIKLARGVHHEVRNPLHAIVLFAKAMFMDAREGRYRDAPKETVISTIKWRTQEMLEEISRICDSLGRFAQFARPNKDVQLTPLYLKGEIEKFLALMREGQKLDTIQVYNSVPHDLVVLASEGGLQEIFFNIFNNSFEAMKGAGSLFIDATENGEFVEVKLRDTGPGISDEILPNIFEDYFTTKSNSEAAGIGLSITRHRVERFGGSIQAVRNGGTGAEFIVKLRKVSNGAK